MRKLMAFLAGSAVAACTGLVVAVSYPYGGAIFCKSTETTLACVREWQATIGIAIGLAAAFLAFAATRMQIVQAERHAHRAERLSREELNQRPIDVLAELQENTRAITTLALPSQGLKSVEIAELSMLGSPKTNSLFNIAGGFMKCVAVNTTYSKLRDAVERGAPTAEVSSLYLEVSGACDELRTWAAIVSQVLAEGHDPRDLRLKTDEQIAAIADGAR